MKSNIINLVEFGAIFHSKLKDAIKSDYNEIRKKIKSERPCSFALVVDGDFSSLFLSIDTFECLEKREKELESKGKPNFEQFADCFDEEEFRLIFENDNEKYVSDRWLPDEWRYGCKDIKNSQTSIVSLCLFDNIGKLMVNYSKSKVGKTIMQEMTLCLKELIDEGFWENKDDIFFFVSMSDDDRAKKIENYSAKMLNDRTLYDLFMKRFD